MQFMNKLNRYLGFISVKTGINCVIFLLEGTCYQKKILWHTVNIFLFLFACFNVQIRFYEFYYFQKLWQ